MSNSRSPKNDRSVSYQGVLLLQNQPTRIQRQIINHMEKQKGFKKRKKGGPGREELDIYKRSNSMEIELFTWNNIHINPVSNGHERPQPRFSRALLPRKLITITGSAPVVVVERVELHGR